MPDRYIGWLDDTDHWDDTDLYLAEQAEELEREVGPEPPLGPYEV